LDIPNPTVEKIIDELHKAEMKKIWIRKTAENGEKSERDRLEELGRNERPATAFADLGIKILSRP
jgi:hypothetical protein